MARKASRLTKVPVAPVETPASIEAIVPACNFCDGKEFVEHMGREGEKCGSCGSLRRHRVALELYRRRNLLAPQSSEVPLRVLHIAPEFILRREITRVVGAGYVCADANPKAYGNAQCLKLVFPESFDIFPDDYFDYVIHNHVLEHIPGKYRDLLVQFGRIVKPWGYHIFSVPGPNMTMDTEEGGEFLSPAERLAKFGQDDHVRQFGRELPETLKNLPNGQFSWDNISNEDRARLNVSPWSNRFLVWRKGREKGAIE